MRQRLLVGSVKATVVATVGHAVRVGGAAAAVVVEAFARVCVAAAWRARHALAVGISTWFSSAPVVVR